MKIAFFADSQVDEHSRLAEHDRTAQFVVADGARRGCTTLLHGGDVFERRSTVRERDSVWAWIDAAVAEGMAVGICGGNHEAIGEVVELDNPTAGVYAYETPAVRFLGEGADGVAVAFLPWPRRASIARWLEVVTGRVPSREEVSEAAPELLRQVLRGLGAQLAAAAPDLPRILLAHVQLSGSKTDPDQPAMVGVDMELSIEDLMLAGADAVLLGHIHLPQEWTAQRFNGGGMIEQPDGTHSFDADVTDVPVIYAGSPRRTAYAKGELVPKGYCVLEFDGRRLVKWERVPTPATPMRLVDLAWKQLVTDPPSWGFDDCLDPRAATGAEIRLRYMVSSDRREEARRTAESWAEQYRAAGALDVKLDEVVEAVTRVRSAEVGQANTLRELMEATWASQGESAPAPERRHRLLELAEEAAAELAAAEAA